ncbi:UNVERIFIED_CONTAM: QnrD family quinolone resistance pentapeptide repeat protein, partial [Salmonella enterica subsp. enterica serovar Weltevreden]
EVSSFHWSFDDFTGCDLTGRAFGELDARRIHLDGVKLAGEQALQLVASLGVIVHR